MSLPFVDHIQARILSSADCCSRLELVLQPFHFNSNGVVHGGVLFTLADTGMGAALYSGLDKTQACATIEMKINYFRPVISGVVECESQLINKGRSTATLESTLTSSGKMVGRAMGTFAIFTRPVKENSPP